MIARGHKKGHPYSLEESYKETLALAKTDSASVGIWHQRLGHPDFKFL